MTVEAHSALPTRRIDRADGSHYHQAFCCWCETTHQHGEGDGNRGAHCHSLSASPLSSYDLQVVEHQCVGDKPSPFPRPGYFGDRALWRSIQKSGATLRRAIVETVLGRKMRGDLASAQLGPRGSRANLLVDVAGFWTLSAHDGNVDGDNLIDLASHLFRIPKGVVAVRILEAATGARLDKRAALAMAAALDEWSGRNAREGR